jgi:hypothetical protein
MGCIYEKHDDATIGRRTVSKIVSNDAWFRENTLTEIFNFRARTVTTVAETACIYTPGGRPAVSGGVPVIRNFRDYEGRDDIVAMHAQLLALGGKPASLEEIFRDYPQPIKKPAFAAPNN